MRISAALNAAINAQIGRELASSNQYLNIGAYFDDRALKKLAKFFFDQANEERDHALRFLTYLTDIDGKVEIPAIPAPKHHFDTAEQAIKLAYDSELNLTSAINALMDQALADKDYAAQEMLRWFITEQVEEVKTMEDMHKVAHQVGERNVIMVEAYLVHTDL
jgi:ferritin